MASIIDIHPHVIATDTARFPLAPLGGTQSTWSPDRPTSWQQMIAEAIAAHPERYTGVF
jgi:L-fuconolactonase